MLLTNVYIVKKKEVKSKVAVKIKLMDNEFNFGFESAKWYLEKVFDLAHLIDSFEPVEPNEATNGGMIIRVLDSVIVVHLTKLNDFTIQIISEEDNRVQFFMLPEGEDLDIFLNSLRTEIVSKLI